MAIDKALYQAPVGIDELAAQEEPLEIEIVNPDQVTLDDGSVEITLTPDDGMGEGDFDANLAEEMDEGEMQSIVGELLDAVRNDLASRKDWEDTYKDLVSQSILENVLNVIS